MEHPLSNKSTAALRRLHLMWCDAAGSNTAIVSKRREIVFVLAARCQGALRILNGKCVFAKIALADLHVHQRRDVGCEGAFKGGLQVCELLNILAMPA